MKQILTGSIILCVISGIGRSQSYNWPCTPFAEQHWINGTFCECREGTSGDRDHFHDGVDIHLPQGEPVYSVINGTVTSYSTEAQSGINAYIRVGRYAYVHVNYNPALSVGSTVTAFETVIGWTNSWNHIHFKDGYPGDEINPIRQSGGLDPLVDTWNPTVMDLKFYINNTETQFQNNRVFGHVDLVSQAWDRTDTGPIGDNNGIFKIGFDVLDSAGNVVFGPRIPFIFSYIPATDNYITNVFAYGSNTGTYRYTITNNVYSDNTLDVSNWELGTYTARVFTFDPYYQSDTLFQPFEVVESDDTPPDPPVLLSIQQNENGFRLNWARSEAPDLLGYRLYFSYNNETWYNNHNETILTSETTEFTAPSFSNELAYFYLTAVDNGPFTNESERSNILVFRKSLPESKILLVDASHNSQIIPGEESIARLGLLIDTYSDLGVESIHDSLIALHGDTLLNKPVSWVHFGTQNTTINDNLINWLINRQSIADAKTLSMGAYIPNLLSTSESGSSYLQSIGIDSTYCIQLFDNPTVSTSGFLASLGVILLDTLIDSIGVGVQFSIIPTQPLMSANDNSYLALAQTSVAENIIFSPPLELFDNPDSPGLLILDHLFPGSVDVVDNNHLFPAAFTLSTFPNPFNGSFNIVIEGNSGLYDIRFFDLIGRNIYSRTIQKSGSQSQSIQFRPEIQMEASGVYFIQVHNRASQHTLTQKVLYLK